MAALYFLRRNSRLFQIGDPHFGLGFIPIWGPTDRYYYFKSDGWMDGVSEGKRREDNTKNKPCPSVLGKQGQED